MEREINIQTISPSISFQFPRHNPPTNCQENLQLPRLLVFSRIPTLNWRNSCFLSLREIAERHSLIATSDIEVQPRSTEISGREWILTALSRSPPIHAQSAPSQCVWLMQQPHLAARWPSVVQEMWSILYRSRGCDKESGTKCQVTFCCLCSHWNVLIPRLSKTI